MKLQRQMLEFGLGWDECDNPVVDDAVYTHDGKRECLDLRQALHLIQLLSGYCQRRAKQLKIVSELQLSQLMAEKGRLLPPPDYTRCGGAPLFVDAEFEEQLPA